ncbi:metalloregulator ArsR/SmtB family transcription factor [Cytophagaceae bacterium DM2B3-1]|uniref:Metalloregulator ArsR/SmtB family transcription factor n=1 Tax=Xanthocytophaga flava TaxID=3048013 RepID=A0ABT7CST5_9BACT|nr:metalloregulator ArsR/SmtB family transcription factor [Xanthocytophaga flavus]MDJ1471328.1 metalloregulator ArsR/SmtB family transcription factor [Xanthocytophaga flavus]MDJ1496793.1 metalloregulator ArsR/SmtB family transcription factor [Xanthocytophaga flavus]
MKPTIQINRERLEKVATILKTVAHPTRLAVIDLLGTQERMSVNDMCEILNCEQSLLSHHLIVLKQRGILHYVKEGQNVYYSLKDKDILKLIACIENCDCSL